MSELKERARRTAKALPRYTTMGQQELEELYEDVEMLYNELRSKYLEALAEPEKNRGLVESLVGKTVELLLMDERGLVEEIALIGLLNLFATDMHDRLAGYIVAEGPKKAL